MVRRNSFQTIHITVYLKIARPSRMLYRVLLALLCGFQVSNKMHACRTLPEAAMNNHDVVYCNSTLCLGWKPADPKFGCASSVPSRRVRTKFVRVSDQMTDRVPRWDKNLPSIKDTVLVLITRVVRQVKRSLTASLSSYRQLHEMG